MDFFIGNAYAQTASGSDSLISLLPLVLIFVVFYFLLIRPQQKRQKEHREMVASLKVGEEVTTAGGLLGEVKEVKDSFVKIEVAPGVILTIQKHTVSSVMPKGTIKAN
ncbi:MAG: preprotein translocase subunit YajC [Pseudomonadota bacterium]|nr:preprotein translocase subunit YajC [Pseudomonadota bacterium]